jgi:glycosyltransferase involved in cell wall biosynthesis
MNARRKRVAIVGTVGVPANYGGFETLVDNIVREHEATGLDTELIVYCSAKAYEQQLQTYRGATLRYVGLQANGPQSILYDFVSIARALREGVDTLLVLGVSGALCLPLVRTFSKARIVTNVDGIEWRRQKWKGLAKFLLRQSERVAVRWSHVVIADNQAIAQHIANQYNAPCEVIAYGGDHAVAAEGVRVDHLHLPERYAVSVCRIEPENNVHMILEAFAKASALPLVMVGNWSASAYGRDLNECFAGHPQITLLDPIYDLGILKTLRQRAAAYVHGHSAGGTNPSLVEAMHFARPILAFDCSFNRHTTEDRAAYFTSADHLAQLLRSVDRLCNGDAMAEIARRRYTWRGVARQYFETLRMR